MNNMKEQKGITLIALVITIIVLLILAGISIAMLTGENGLFKRATDAATESEIGEAKEQVSLTINDLVSDYYQKKYAGNTTDASDVNGKNEVNYVKEKLNDALDANYATATDEGKITLTPKRKDNKNITATYDGNKLNWIEEAGS